MKISQALKEAEKTGISDVIAMCDLAKELEDSGEYKKASEALGKWWQGIGVKPHINKLSIDRKAAILSRVGALSGWLGSMKQIPDSQEKAKDLLSEGSDLFQKIEDHQNWAEIRSDLAVCYWREGSFDEARVILQNVLDKDFTLPPELFGKVLLRLVNVEISTKHFNKAMELINQATSIASKGSALLRGKLYFHRALIQRSEGEDKDRLDLLLAAAEDYKQAGVYYQRANHYVYAAAAENNLGNIYRLLNKHKDAHSHFDRAIYLYTRCKDQIHAAQVYESKATVLLAENKRKDAEMAARQSVSMLRTGGEQSLLAESLTTLAIVLSRGGDFKEAINTFVEAKEAALSVSDNESAGNALLTHIEELQPYLKPIEIRKLYLEADELLTNSPKIGTINRLQKIARKQLEVNSTDALFKSEKFFSWKNFSLPDAIHTYEGEIILKAINDAGGRVTKAARLLGMPHQSLSIILHNRHKELKQHCIQRKPRRDGKAESH
jgi:tetratricopeptide (TPR) repeat protein